jgi:DNA-binding XRE family transcriptional regulator
MDAILLQLGKNIEVMRRRRGLTQDMLAREISATRNTIARIERGEQNPSVVTLAKIAVTLEITLAGMFRNCGPYQENEDSA